MSEIQTRYALIEEHRREALLLGRNPYVKEVLQESQFVLQKTFGFTTNQFDLVNGVSFISFEDRSTLGVANVIENNFLIHEFRKRGIKPKSDYLPNIPPYSVDKKSVNDRAIISLGANYFSPYFLEGVSKPMEFKNPSIGAVVLFINLTESVMQGLTVPVELEIDEETLKTLGRRSLSGVPGKVENPFDPKFKQFMEEISERVEAGKGLAIQAEGAHVALTLDGLILDSFYEEEEVGLGFVINEGPEDNFKRRMAASKISGKRWFIQPETWNPKLQYRAYRQHELYLPLLEMVEKQGPASIRERILKSEMASVFLLRDGIAHERHEVVREPVVSEPVKFLETRRNREPVVIERRYENLQTEKAPKPQVAQGVQESVLIPEATEVKLPKKVKEKKRRTPPPVPVPPQRFGRRLRPAPRIEAPEPSAALVRNSLIEIKHNPPPEVIFEPRDIVDQKRLADNLAKKAAVNRARRANARAEKKAENEDFWQKMRAKIEARKELESMASAESDDSTREVDETTIARLLRAANVEEWLSLRKLVETAKDEELRGPMINEETKELLERFKHLLDEARDEVLDAIPVQIEGDDLDEQIRPPRFERIVTKKDRSREI